MTVKNREAHMSHETRIAVLENTIGYIHETLERIERNMEKGFSEVNKRIDFLDNKIDSKFDILDKKIDSNFKWLLGMIIAGFISMAGVIAHALHWV
jgi:hypothetical protein